MAKAGVNADAFCRLGLSIGGRESARVQIVYLLGGTAQVWVWQDEWLGLTMADVEQMERETQAQLAALFGAPQSQGKNRDSKKYFCARVAYKSHDVASRRLS